MYPSFLGIGAQKAGTTWLAKNLQSHPDIWIPPIKEIHYFDRPPNWVDPVQMIIGDRPITGAEADWIENYNRTPRDDKWYASLFRDGENLTSGEITPGYSTLNRDEVSRVHSLMPDANILFFVRNPVERVWSQAVMYFERRGRNALSVPFEELRNHARLEHVKVRSNYLRTLHTWRRFYPDQRIFLGFVEDIYLHPSRLLEAVYRFLEVDPGFRPVGFEAKIHSRSLGAMPGRFAALLANQNLNSIGRLCDQFGGYAEFWLYCANSILDKSDDEKLDYPFVESDYWSRWLSDTGISSCLQSDILARVLRGDERPALPS